MVFSTGTLYLFYHFLQHCPWDWGKQDRQALLITLFRWGKGLRSYMASFSPQMRGGVEIIPGLMPPTVFPDCAPNLNQFWDTFFHLNLTKNPAAYVMVVTCRWERISLTGNHGVTLLASEYLDTDYQVQLQHLHARLASDSYFPSCNVSLKQWSLSYCISGNKNIKPS